MMKAPRPRNERQRLAALRRYGILDTAPEEEFDALTRQTAHICGTPVALVSLVDVDRQWFKSNVGLDCRETPRDVAFCAHAILQQDIFIVPDALADERFATNPLVTSGPKLRFYAGMPLTTPDGYGLGTLCVVDYVPRELNAEQREALRVLARQVMTQLELRRSVAELERSMSERKLAEEALRKAHNDLERRVQERTAELARFNTLLEREIAERRRAEDTLRQSEERYRDLFENANDIIYTHDLTGRFTSTNRAAEEVTGYTREEALTENIAKVVAPEYLEQAREMILRKLRGEPSTVYELEIVTKDGRRVPVEVSTRVIYQDGKPVGVQGIARDITERRRAEEALRQAQTETVMLLAAAAEAYDQTTGLHLQDVRVLTEALARELGYREEGASALGLAAVLHDVGKFRVPDSMLAATGPLGGTAWQVMQRHTVWGEEFLAGRAGFELATAIARCHHERWDGGGYPDGLAGDAIPEAAAIVAVADAFDAITHDRPYQARRSVDKAVREIVAETGTQFSPKVVAALERLYRRNALPLMPSRVADQAAA